jgi:glycosyltransferase involved in cell wall biosynthesis
MDRVKLLMEASDQIEHLTLIVGLLDRSVDCSNHQNFEIIEIGFKRRMRPLNMWKSSRVAENILREQDADVVHDTMGMLYPLFRKKSDYPQVRFVTSFFILFGWRLSHVWHKYSTFHLLTATSTAMMYPNRWLERRMAQMADHVVLQAPGLTDHLVSDVPSARNKTHVITNNVDAEFWTPSPRRMSNERLNLLFVGGVDHSKGFFVLLDTMAELRNRGVDAILTVVGRPNSIAAKQVQESIHRMSLEDTVQFNDRVNREELREFYRSADIFIYQTINDGSPRVVLEALACELPVIGSTHPGIEVLDSEKRFIAFSDFGDIQTIVEHVEDFLRDSEAWSQRATLGRKTIETEFTSRAVAQQYADFYTAIVSEKIRSSTSSRTD